MTSEKSALEQVYAASSAEELAAAYAEWSSEYDRETVGEGYCLPFIIAGWIARYVPKGGGPLLDAGCGTGLSGPYLRALGYDAIEGLDFSEKMLALARQRNAYRALTQADARQDAAVAGRAFRRVPVDRRLHRRPRAGLEPRRTRAHHAARRPRDLHRARHGA